MPVKAGLVYRKFVTEGGREVTLRAVKWEDLDDLMRFANELATEHQENPDFGVLLSKRVTRDEEADWLARKLARMEQEKEFSVAAEADGRLVGNSEIVRGNFDDTKSHGQLGIAIARGYRGMGIGIEMLQTVLDLSRKAGLKSVELEVLSSNPRAAALYRKAGFKRVGVIRGKVRRGRKVIDTIVMTRDL